MVSLTCVYYVTLAPLVLLFPRTPPHHSVHSPPPPPSPPRPCPILYFYQPITARPKRQTHRRRRQGDRTETATAGTHLKYTKSQVPKYTFTFYLLPRHAATGATIKVRLSVRPFTGKTRGILSTTHSHPYSHAAQVHTSTSSTVINKVPISLFSSLLLLSPTRAKETVLRYRRSADPFLAVSPVSCEQPASLELVPRTRMGRGSTCQQEKKESRQQKEHSHNTHTHTHTPLKKKLDLRLNSHTLCTVASCNLRLTPHLQAAITIATTGALSLCLDPASAGIRVRITDRAVKCLLKCLLKRLLAFPGYLYQTVTDQIHQHAALWSS